MLVLSNDIIVNREESIDTVIYLVGKTLEIAS